MMMMMSSFRKKKPALNVHKKQFRLHLNEKHRTEQTQNATYCRTKQQTETETNLGSKTKNRIELERNEQIYGQLII